MSGLHDRLPVGPMAPVRLWPGGPIDIDHYRGEVHRLRALEIAQALRTLGLGLRWFAPRRLRSLAPAWTGHA
jgi:hypothetical protein